MKQAGQYYWYHNDQLGTPQMITTSSGAVVWRASYSSFGKVTVDPGSTVTNQLRFPGQYEDIETGLYQNLWRYYDPSLGRYLRSDPIGLNGGINLFAYVHNPITWMDPAGLSSSETGGAYDIFHTRDMYTGYKVLDYTVMPIINETGHFSGFVFNAAFNAVGYTGAAIHDAETYLIVDLLGGYPMDVEVINALLFLHGAELANILRNLGEYSRCSVALKNVLDKSNFKNKLADYLLNPSHPQNQSKAVWFEKALGFNKSNWKKLAKQIKFDESVATVTKTTEFGTHYLQKIPIKGINGRVIDVPFVFMKDSNGVVKLVTGIPAK